MEGGAAVLSTRLRGDTLGMVTPPLGNAVITGDRREKPQAGLPKCAAQMRGESRE